VTRGGAAVERDELKRWWRTALVEARPGAVRLRGYPIEELMGNVRWGTVVWLVLRGELPRDWEAELLEAVLVAGVDHGPMAPSIAIARMAASCGVALSAAAAAGLAAIGDVHGGAGEQCMKLLYRIEERARGAGELSEVVEAVLDEIGSERVPGYGHRFHRSGDPRAVRLCEMVRARAEQGQLSGIFLRIGRAVEESLGRRKGRALPMNVDGAIAVTLCELGFGAPAGKAVFLVSRCLGIVAHAMEEVEQGGRLKGPMPPEVGYVYEGPGVRDYRAERKGKEVGGEA
jgi:citrate synthase